MNTYGWLILVVVAALLSFGAGYFVCARRIPRVLSEMDLGQLRTLAGKVSDLRTHVSR